MKTNGTPRNYDTEERNLNNEVCNTEVVSSGKNTEEDSSAEEIDLRKTEPAKEICISQDHTEDLSEVVAKHQLILPTGRRLGYVDTESVETWIKKHGHVYGKSTQLGSALEANSDLVPSVYEGGLKIWECSVDLVQYLISTEVDFHGKKVLELGCGAGLPGIYALIQGAEVHFQDYNWEVLDFITIPNLLLNTVYKERMMAEEGDENEDDPISDTDDGTDESAEESETEEGPLKKQKLDSTSHTATKYSVEKQCDKISTPKFMNKSKKVRSPEHDTHQDKDHEKLIDEKHLDDQIANEKLVDSRTMENNPENVSHKDTKITNNNAPGALNEKDVSREKTTSELVSQDETFSAELEEVKKKSTFIAGDWDHVANMLETKHRYDVILTAETIYSTDSYEKLQAIMKTLLKPDGVIYLAAKTYYFGVGGGTRSFEESVKKAGIFNIKPLVVFDEGLKREILELKFKL